MDQQADPLLAGLEPDDYGDPLLPNAGAESPQKRAANKRNDSRINFARKTDDKIISKYLPDDPKSFITKTVTGPNDHFCPPQWLMEAIKEVAADSEETPSKPPVAFEMNQDAASHHLALLGDRSRVTEQFPKARVSRVREFRLTNWRSQTHFRWPMAIHL
jgi:hypothetical protein